MTFTTQTVAIIVLAVSSVAYGHPNHTESDQPDKRSVASPQVGQDQAGHGEPTKVERIELPDSSVSISIEGDKRVIRSNGIPDHATGEFPNSGNPNAIREMNHELVIPLHPKLNDEPMRSGPEFGIALNGIPFDAGTGEFWTEDGRRFGVRSAWNYEALGGGVDLGLDSNNAHVQPTGKYHYHGLPTGLLKELGGEQGIERMIQIGWAADGFPIYGPFGYSDPMDPASKIIELESSYQLKVGSRPTAPGGPGGEYNGDFGIDWEFNTDSGDLDECNGRFGVTPEFPEGTYYYVVSDSFPQIPRMWHGQPDESMRRPGGNRPPPENGQRRGMLSRD